MRIICSGGGTGGHIFPAIAVAEEIVKRNPNAEVLFIGAQGRMEMTKVPKAGFDIKGLWISGFQRELTLKNLTFPFKLISSLWEARRIIKEFKPDVVAGFGGYASGAALWVATKMEIPTLIQEQNSYPGVTNRILSKNVDTICLAYEEAQGHFENSKIVLTGNPVRDLKVDSINKGEARSQLLLEPNKTTVLVIGGSLGAKSINENLNLLHSEIEQRHEVQWLWQCGGSYIKEYKDCATAQLKNVIITDFIERMDIAYAAVDIVICRSGALTISELMLLQKPVILIPSPNVAEAHQTKNAMALVNAGAARIVKDNKIKEELLTVLDELLEDHDQRGRIGEKIKSLGKPNATKDIVDQIELLIKNRK